MLTRAGEISGLKAKPPGDFAPARLNPERATAYRIGEYG